MTDDSSFDLSDLQLDALTELVNMGVGRAAGNLARMVGEEVTLTVPRVALLTRADAVKTLTERETQNLVAIHQVFDGGLNGRALLIFPEERSLELVRCVINSELSLEELIELEHEALAETGNIVINSCLATIANALNTHLNVSLPEVVYGEGSFFFSLEPPPASSGKVMFIYINFAVKSRNIDGYIAVMMDIPALSVLRIMLEDLIRRTAGEDPA